MNDKHFIGFMFLPSPNLLSSYWYSYFINDLGAKLSAFLAISGEANSLTQLYSLNPMFFLTSKLQLTPSCPETDVQVD